MNRSLLAFSATCLAVAVATPAKAESYSVKQTIVGTMIPQPVVTSAIPLDKTYAELTAAQKAVIAQDYEALPAGDEPPFPARGLGRASGYIARYAEQTNQTGPVVAAVDVGPDGQARSVTVYKSPDGRLTQIVTTLLMDETYKAARCGGSPCAMQYVLRMDIPARNGQHVTGAVPGDYMGSKRGM